MITKQAFEQSVCPNTNSTSMHDWRPMLPFLEKNKNKMISTLMDGRGQRTEVSPDHPATKDGDYNHELERACTAFLGAIERKSIPDLMKASTEIHQACDKQLHQEGPHTEESEEVD